jgi:hypothetical protein
MPTVVNLRNDNLTANAKTTNLLAATDLQQAPSDGLVVLYGVSSAAGVNIEFGVGGDKAISDREIVFIGTTVDKSAHKIAEFPVAAGENLSLFLRETAGVATTDVIQSVEFYSAEEIGG